MTRVLVKAGRVVDPASRRDSVSDVYVADGRVLAVGDAPAGFHADVTLDAGGCVVCPGLVDLRARLREPGAEHKATIASESRAAVAGGITTVCVPPDTEPAVDTPAVAELIHQRAAAAGGVRIEVLGALTQGLGGELLAEMAHQLAVYHHHIHPPQHHLHTTNYLQKALHLIPDFWQSLQITQSHGVDMC